MRKIVFFYSTGYVGMEGAALVEYPDDVTEDILNEEAWQHAVQHAESYGIYPEEDLQDISDEEYEAMEESGELDNYSHNIEGYWEDYNAEKHDGLL